MSHFRVLFLAAGLALLLYTGCSSDSNAATPEEDVVSIGVQVATVERGRIVSVIDAVGTIQAIQEATLSSRVPGRVAVFPFEVGDEIAAGDLLLQLEQEEFRLAVQQATAAVGSAEARLDGAERMHRRVNELQAQHIASTEQKDNAATELAVAQAEVREARAALDIARDQQAQSTLIAPFPGAVASTHVHVGERIGPGQPLLRVVSLDAVEVDVTISEKRIADVALDQQVHTRVDGFPGELFVGVVRRLSPTVDPVSRTFTATVQLTNPHHRLRPGMFARVEIQVGEHPDALVVHRAGLLEQAGEVWAVRVQGPKAERVQVSTGYRYGDRVEVLDGLAAGDRVVTEGAYGLANGARVHIVSQE